jgi:predicted glycoside hydrolase/deacetylase ChbG (UPF0249 family)
MTANLIVNADDYGRTSDVSRGIREAHQHGIVTSTTVLINLPSSTADLFQATQEAPQLAIGLHLNLTLGFPILPAECIPSLVAQNGHFLGRDLLFQRIRSINPEDVYAEWRAQIEFMLSVYKRPDHLDSHHHVALLSPEIWEVCLRLAREFNCPVRPPIPGDLTSTELEAFLPPSSIEFAMESAVAQLGESGVPSPDLFLAGIFGEGATRARLNSRLRQPRAGISELMCHPGYSSEILAGSSGYSLQREHELQLLTEPELQESIHDAGWTLTSYGELWKPGPGA